MTRLASNSEFIQSLLASAPTIIILDDLEVQSSLAISGRAMRWAVRPPQDRGQQRQNNHHHAPGEKQNLIALRVAMVPFVARLVVHFAHHLANRRAWQAVLFEQPREQWRDSERRQVIRQFHLAHLKDHQRDGAGDQPGGGVDGIKQLAFLKKRQGVKLAG